MKNLLFEIIKSYKNWIPIGISFLTLVIVVIRWIIEEKNKRAKISVQIVSIEKQQPQNTIICFYITNHSTNPISVTNIFLKIQHGYLMSLLTKRWISQRTYPKFPETDIPLTEMIFSQTFPINLIANQTVMAFVIFPSDNLETGNTYQFKFITDKKQFKFDLQIPEKVKEILSL